MRVSLIPYPRGLLFQYPNDRLSRYNRLKSGLYRACNSRFTFNARVSARQWDTATNALVLSHPSNLAARFLKQGVPWTGGDRGEAWKRLIRHKFIPVCGISIHTVFASSGHLERGLSLRCYRRPTMSGDPVHDLESGLWAVAISRRLHSRDRGRDPLRFATLARNRRIPLAIYRWTVARASARMHYADRYLFRGYRARGSVPMGIPDANADKLIPQRDKKGPR